MLVKRYAIVNNAGKCVVKLQVGVLISIAKKDISICIVAIRNFFCGYKSSNVGMCLPAGIFTV